MHSLRQKKKKKRKSNLTIMGLILLIHVGDVLLFAGVCFPLSVTSDWQESDALQTPVASP